MNKTICCPKCNGSGKIKPPVKRQRLLGRTVTGKTSQYKGKYLIEDLNDGDYWIAKLDEYGEATSTGDWFERSDVRKYFTFV